MDCLTRNTAATVDTRVLSVHEAVSYIDEHFGDTEYRKWGHLVSESKVRRLLNEGTWPLTRTSRGYAGITVNDLEAIWRRAD